MSKKRHKSAVPLIVSGWVLFLAGCGNTYTTVGDSTPSPSATATAARVSTATESPLPSVTATATAPSTATFTAAPPTATVPPTAPPSPTPAAFRVQSSVEQLLISDAIPGTQLAVRNGSDTPLQTGTVDAQGTLIFRDLAPGAGYVVSSVDGSPAQESEAVEVWAMDQPPPNDFYTAQRLEAGYQYIVMRDGTKLAVNVILPGPPENGPYPTVVEYSGYDPANPDSPQPSTLVSSILGYAAVGVNMRGTGCSGGSFKFFEPAQSTDGYDLVEIIAQQPWVKFNKVGMVGVSYPGISQLFTAQTQPPHLAAITPLSVISDTVRGVLYPGGILNNGFATDWARSRQEDGEPFGQPWSAKRRDQGDEVCIENQRFRGQNPDLLDIIYDNTYYRPDIADRLSPANFVDKINVPVFLAGAWQDEQTGGYFANMIGRFTGTDKAHFTLTNGGHADSLGPEIFTRWAEFLSFYVRREIPVLPGTAKLALTVIAQQVFGVKRVKVGADRFVGEPSFESALAKFEAEPRVRILFESGAGSTEPGGPVPRFEKSFDSWPVPSTEPTVWYFGDNGRLTSEPASTDGADSYVYDPTLSQLTSLVGDDSQVWKAQPNWIWRQAGNGEDVRYETDDLDQTLVMSGTASVDLWLRSTAPNTDLQVVLSEVRPDGQEVYVQSGFLRAIHRAVEPTESTILRPVHTLLERDAAPLPAGEFSLTRVEVFPFAHVFRTGSRIRITVGTPGGTRPRWKFDVLESMDTVVNTVAHSAGFPSRVVLPVLPGVEAPQSLPPCPSLRLQYCRTVEPISNTPAD